MIAHSGSFHDEKEDPEWIILLQKPQSPKTKKGCVYWHSFEQTDQIGTFPWKNSHFQIGIKINKRSKTINTSF